MGTELNSVISTSIVVMLLVNATVLVVEGGGWPGSMELTGFFTLIRFSRDIAPVSAILLYSSAVFGLLSKAPNVR